ARCTKSARPFRSTPLPSRTSPPVRRGFHAWRDWPPPFWDPTRILQPYRIVVTICIGFKGCSGWRRRMIPFAELAVTTNFSFLRGGSGPEEMVVQAEALGLAGIAVADRNTVAGVVRGYAMAKARGYRYAVGTRLVFRDGTPDVLAWPTDREAWGRP